MEGDISTNSRRVARNTVILYFRMLLLMFIGLFTSRMVLKALGVEDYGTYGAVGGIVTIFTVITSSISQSIGRYITFELGKDEPDRLRRIFSTGVVMQLLFCAVVLVLTETLGRWWLNCRMQIPEGRLDAANWVLQCSMGVLMVNLLSTPFNATIIAHEKMGAYAFISILEAALKLGVALLLCTTTADKLKCYAVLMLAVAVIIRAAYGAYCKAHFAESRGKLVFDRTLVSEMTRFAGWNCLGSGAYIINTQGVNQLVNVFFGVGANAARYVASQVETIVKQFVTNFLTALNPQITKSYASGNTEYCRELVCKGAKFSCLVMLFFIIPLILEMPALLGLWLKDVPEGAVLFSRLVLIGLVADMACNPLLTMIQATGRIKGYYIVTSATSVSVFLLSWAAFRMGADAHIPYIIFAAVYLIVDVEKAVYARKLSDFSISEFIRSTVLPVTAVSVISLAVTLPVWYYIRPGWARLICVVITSSIAVCASSWFTALSTGERAFFKSHLKNVER